jgi:hypothetical protein
LKDMGKKLVHAVERHKKGPSRFNPSDSPPPAPEAARADAVWFCSEIVAGPVGKPFSPQLVDSSCKGNSFVCFPTARCNKPDVHLYVCMDEKDSANMLSYDL